MSTDSSRDYVFEQLATLIALWCPRMYGSHGLYCGGQFFGIVYNGRLYFKTHPDTLPDYLSRHCAVFAPSEKRVLKNYRDVIVEIREDAAQLTSRAARACQLWILKL